MGLDALPAFVLGLPYLVSIPLCVGALGITVIAWTHLYTHLRYELQVRRFAKAGSDTAGLLSPPAIPYTLPVIGNAFAFLDPQPGKFWKGLVRNDPGNVKAWTLLLGGRTTHVVADPIAVQALFKSRGLTRDRLNLEVTVKGFGLPKAEGERFYVQNAPSVIDEKGREVTAKDRLHHVWQEYLTKNESVNELTRGFMTWLLESFKSDAAIPEGKTIEAGIVEWFRPHMFRASTNALFGTRLLEVYPEVATDFWEFDNNFMTIFTTPHALIPKEKKLLDTVQAGLVRWQNKMLEECNGTPLSPHAADVSWEPIFGSRLIRARQYFYREMEFSIEANAAGDLGFMFALASNAIPTALWILMHLLDPNGDRTVLPRLMEELETAKLPDGKLNVPVLVSLPLFQSLFHEAMRLYGDVAVTRDLEHDIELPSGKGQRKLAFAKGTTVMAPSYLGHHNEAWGELAPVDTFYADRFLREDAETGKLRFSTTGTAGMLFPFGGGAAICPGRMFAKQEVMGAVAMTLLQFEFEAVGCLDGDGKATMNFPRARQSVSGGGIVGIDGDVKVRIRRRAW